MKFRDTKTGRMFKDISVAADFFCSKQVECKDCPIRDVDDDNDEWLKNNQIEAAKLMGYEIIEDGDDKMETKKSYLAEILGLEEDEVFGVEWTKFIYRIHGGRRQAQSNVGMWLDCNCENDLAYLIENRDKITKVKRLTEQEKKICEDCGAKWVSKDDVGKSVYLWEEKPVSALSCKNYSCGGLIAAFTDSKRFPSVKPGDLIEVM